MKCTLSWEVDRKLCNTAHTRINYKHIYVPYVHNPESARKILQTRLKKGNDYLRKPAIDMLDF